MEFSGFNCRSNKESGHNNTVCVPGVDNAAWQAENVAFGAFRLNKDQGSRVDNMQEYPLAGYKVPESLKGNSLVTHDELYISAPATGPKETRPVIGILLLSAVLALVVWYIRRKRNRRTAKETA